MEGGKTVSKAAYKTAKTNKIKRSRADLKKLQERKEKNHIKGWVFNGS